MVATEQAAAGMSADLVGELVALRPVQDEKLIETSVGKNAARFCEALIIVDGLAEPDPKYRNLGETPIFWEVVRRQLDDARPWLVGVIQKTEGTRFYRVTPPDPDLLDGVRRVLKRHVNNPISVEQPETDQDEAPF